MTVTLGVMLIGMMGQRCSVLDSDGMGFGIGCIAFCDQFSARIISRRLSKT